MVKTSPNVCRCASPCLMGASALAHKGKLLGFSKSGIGPFCRTGHPSSLHSQSRKKKYKINVLRKEGGNSQPSVAKNAEIAFSQSIISSWDMEEMS